MINTATIPIAEARRGLNRIDERLKDTPVILVTRHGKNVFAFVESEYFEMLLETLEIMSDPELRKMLKDSLDDIRQGRLIDHDDVGKELGLTDPQ